MVYAATKSVSEVRRRGRPREFNMEDALDKAVKVFAERGYHATSIMDLAQAMELASGSIYKAFTDKRSIFLAALDRYMDVRGAKLKEAIRSGQTGRDRIRKALTFYVDSSYGLIGKQGCPVVGSASELASSDEEVACRIRAAFDRYEALMTELIGQGQADGSIAKDIPVKAIVRCMLCMVQGMRVVSKTGRARPEMVAMVDIIMRTLSWDYGLPANK